MELLIAVLMLMVGFAAGIAAHLIGRRIEKKASRKKRTPWLTANQLGVLESIMLHGRGGLPLWQTDINLATIRSLAKRGFCDTASRGRIVITRAGRKRLLEPWPAEQPTGDQKDRADASGSGAAQNEPTGSQAASEPGG